MNVREKMILSEFRARLKRKREEQIERQRERERETKGLRREKRHKREAWD